MSGDRPVEYHTVPIRPQLPKIPKYYQEVGLQQLPNHDFWVDKLMRPYKDGRTRRYRLVGTTTVNPDQYRVQYTLANESYTHNGDNHAIIKAFLHAYNSHEDIILSPDDIWLMICIAFSEYVDANSEQLRQLFVDHQGKKELTIFQEADEPDWEDFLERMRREVGNHVKADVNNLLTNNFSTTRKVETLISCLSTMTIFKKYFTFGVLVGGCGIRNVHFMGSLDDWKTLRQKTEQLNSFTSRKPNDHFVRYITGLLPILDQFVQTYQGRVDNQFWDTIFNLEHINDASGVIGGTYMNGWSVRLCYGNHMHQKCHYNDIQLKTLTVPVNVIYEMKKESKTSYIVGGFHGVRSVDGMHRPVMSLAVIDDTTTFKKI